MGSKIVGKSVKKKQEEMEKYSVGKALLTWASPQFKPQYWKGRALVHLKIFPQASSPRSLEQAHHVSLEVWHQPGYCATLQKNL